MNSEKCLEMVIIYRRNLISAICRSQPRKNTCRYERSRLSKPSRIRMHLTSSIFCILINLFFQFIYPNITFVKFFEQLQFNFPQFSGILAPPGKYRSYIRICMFNKSSSARHFFLFSHKLYTVYTLKHLYFYHRLYVKTAVKPYLGFFT